MRILLVLAAAFCLPLPASAVNKCVGADGRAVFQDMPCADGRGEKMVIRPASGNAPMAPPATATQAAGVGAATAAPQTEVERLRALADRLRDGNRISSLEVRVIPDAYGRVNAQKARCDAEFEALRARKAQANNNLAGATWEQSISSEMAAVATRCDTEGRVLQADLDRYQKELAALKGGARQP